MSVSEYMRPTRIEIDLCAIKTNISTVRTLVSKGTKILLPVKADAYGHGAIPVSSYVQEHSLVDVLGVASVEEGIELRENGISLPILILGTILPDSKSAESLVRHNLTAAVCDGKVALEISRAAQKIGKKTAVHVKIDTGMHRLGVAPEKLPSLLDDILSCGFLELAGVFSHMPLADEAGRSFNEQQIEMFTNAVLSVKKMNPSVCVHLSNSAAILNFRNADFSMVRPGIFSYGYAPFKGWSGPAPIPAMRMLSAIIAVSRIKAGESVSYGHIHTCEKDSYIATVPVGYADGYHRSLSNKAYVLIHNKQYPVVGRICMDLMMVDCGDDEFSCGTEVELFGNGIITADTLADIAQTISYEICTAPSRRVPRDYIF